MTSETTIYLVPVSFGYGPAALAVAVARALRQHQPHLRVAAVADGLAAELLADSGVLDAASVIRVDAGRLPEDIATDRHAVWVGFADFNRLGLAAERGHRSIMVDPLWWMWEKPPALSEAGLQRYLVLRFPGIEQTLPEAAAPTFRVVPQVVEAGFDGPQPADRSGVLLNLGGGFAPGIDSLPYLQAVVDIVASCCPDTDVLVASSSEIIARLAPPQESTHLSLRSLRRPEMLHELRQRARLITVPGQSIIWEALAAQIPTIIVPGTNYSQHRQVPFYQSELRNTPLLPWDFLPGYQSAPAGLAQPQGLVHASEASHRFAADPAARAVMQAWLRAALLLPEAAPSVAAGSVWRELNGAEVIAQEIADVARSHVEAGPRMAGA